MPAQTNNLAASIRQRLLNLARDRNEDFQLLLIRYGMERLLYRLGKSAHGQNYILKGATLYPVWGLSFYRPTMDIDLLGHGDSDPDYLKGVFQNICRTEVESDGLSFDLASIRAEPIRDQMDYGGVRVSLVAGLANARITLQVDIGFGDVVYPRPESIDYPTLLNLPGPKLLGYSRETVVAEKFQAMIHLGMVNSRMKDFYDIWALAHNFEFKGKELFKAVELTFNRRQTAIPEILPLPFSEEFSGDQQKQQQWKAFIGRNALLPPDVHLEQVIEFLKGFLWAPCKALGQGTSFSQTWQPGGPWR